MPIIAKIGSNTIKAIPLANISNNRFTTKGNFFLFIFKASFINTSLYLNLSQINTN